MTDEEIIKILEICTGDTTDCKDCPLVESECRKLEQYSFDLIKRQQAEITTLKSKARVTQHFLSKAWESIEGKDKLYETIKAEAIKEFVKTLKAEMNKCSRCSMDNNTYYIVGTSLIDNLVKEITGDKFD